EGSEGAASSDRVLMPRSSSSRASEPVKPTWTNRQRTNRQLDTPTSPAILSWLSGRYSRVRMSLVVPMAQLSKTVPFITAITAGPSMTQSGKVFPPMAIGRAFQCWTASDGGQTASLSKVVRATRARPAASSADMAGVWSVILCLCLSVPALVGGSHLIDQHLQELVAARDSQAVELAVEEGAVAHGNGADRHLAAHRAEQQIAHVAADGAEIDAVEMHVFQHQHHR